jgi:anti-sigma factor RsiW
MADEERRLLELLAASPDGRTDMPQLIYDFPAGVIRSVIDAKLATMTPERVFMRPQEEPVVETSVETTVVAAAEEPTPVELVAAETIEVATSAPAEVKREESLAVSSFSLDRLFGNGAPFALNGRCGRRVTRL